MGTSDKKPFHIKELSQALQTLNQCLRVKLAEIIPLIWNITVTTN